MLKIAEENSDLKDDDKKLVRERSAKLIKESFRKYLSRKKDIPTCISGTLFHQKQNSPSGDSPQEILLQIFSEWNPKQLIAAGQDCREWHSISEDNFLWSRFLGKNVPKDLESLQYLVQKYPLFLEDVFDDFGVAMDDHYGEWSEKEHGRFIEIIEKYKISNPKNLFKEKTITLENYKTLFLKFPQFRNAIWGSVIPEWEAYVEELIDKYAELYVRHIINGTISPSKTPENSDEETQEKARHDFRDQEARKFVEESNMAVLLRSGKLDCNQLQNFLVQIETRFIKKKGVRKKRCLITHDTKVEARKLDHLLTILRSPQIYSLICDNNLDPNDLLNLNHYAEYIFYCLMQPMIVDAIYSNRISLRELISLIVDECRVDCENNSGKLLITPPDLFHKLRRDYSDLFLEDSPPNLSY